MPKAKSSASQVGTKSRRKALTPEAREQQLINLAMDRAEEQLRDGTASSQVITHFLKLGTENAKLEREILKGQNELIAAKTKAIQDQADIKELYENALSAMQIYGGTANVTRGDSDD